MSMYSSALRKAATHGLKGACSAAGGEDRRRLGGTHHSTHWVRAAWSKFRAAECRFSDSIWGDLVGGVALVGIFVLGMYFIPLAYAPQDQLPHANHVGGGADND